MRTSLKILWAIPILIASNFGLAANKNVMVLPAAKTAEFGFDSARLSYPNFNIKTPVCWKVELFSGGRVIFTKTSCDNRIDSFFKDSSYTEGLGCQGYEDCKRTWYLRTLGASLVYKGSVSAFSMDTTSSPVLETAYREQGMNKKEAKQRSDMVLRLVRERKVSLFFPQWAPVGDMEFPKVYDRRLRRFLPLFEW